MIILFFIIDDSGDKSVEPNKAVKGNCYIMNNHF